MEIRVEVGGHIWTVVDVLKVKRKGAVGIKVERSWKKGREKTHCQRRCLGSVGSLPRKKKSRCWNGGVKHLDSVWKRRGRRKVVKRKEGQQKRCCFHNRSTGW
jgi:hypothetical protein